MIKLYSKIIGTKIVLEETGDFIALVTDIIVNPDTGKVEALWIKSPVIPIPNAVLKTDDIIKWKNNIYVKEQGVFADPSDIISVAEILTKETLIINNKVVDEDDTIIGRAIDLDFDSELLYIKNIYVEKTFLNIFKYGSRTFAYDSIVKIEKKRIVVNTKDSAIKIKAGETAAI